MLITVLLVQRLVGERRLGRRAEAQSAPVPAPAIATR
jgi:hypothetical protein